MAYESLETSPLGSLSARSQPHPSLILPLPYYPHWQDVVALIAYESPEASPLGSLMARSQREKVADVVNAAVLAAAAAASSGGAGGEGPGAEGGATAMQTEAAGGVGAGAQGAEQQLVKVRIFGSLG